MGVKIINLDLLAVNIGDKQVLAIYVGSEKVWPTIILSCYSNGYWIDEYPWIDDTPWMD